MRVLILRPEPQASAMAAELADLGIEATVEPMLAIHLAAGVVPAVLAPGGPPAGLILTSAHAVAALRQDPGLPDLFVVPVVAVGPATATAARSAGFIVVIEAAGDAAAVVDLVSHRFSPGVGRIVHVAGRDRTGNVAESLSARGFDVQVVEAYRAEAVERLGETTREGLAGGGFDAVVVASARTAASFAAALAAAGIAGPLEAPTLVAISTEAAEPLAGLFARIATAASADGEGLLKAVVALRPPIENTQDPPEPPAD